MNSKGMVSLNTYVRADILGLTPEELINAVDADEGRDLIELASEKVPTIEEKEFLRSLQQMGNYHLRYTLGGEYLVVSANPKTAEKEELPYRFRKEDTDPTMTGDAWGAVLQRRKGPRRRQEVIADRDSLEREGMKTGVGGVTGIPPDSSSGFNTSVSDFDTYRGQRSPSRSPAFDGLPFDEEKKEEKKVCPNCGQWQYLHKGEWDCLNDCNKRGFGSKKTADTTVNIDTLNISDKGEVTVKDTDETQKLKVKNKGEEVQSPDIGEMSEDFFTPQTQRPVVAVTYTTSSFSTWNPTNPAEKAKKLKLMENYLCAYDPNYVRCLKLKNFPPSDTPKSDLIDWVDTDLNWSEMGEYYPAEQTASLKKTADEAVELGTPLGLAGMAESEQVEPMEEPVKVFNRVQELATGTKGWAVEINNSKPGDADIGVVWDEPIHGDHWTEVHPNEIVVLEEKIPDDIKEELEKEIARHSEEKESYDEEFKEEVRSGNPDEDVNSDDAKSASLIRKGATFSCPNCGSNELVRESDYPDTGTSVDMFEAECMDCGKFYVVSQELQDGSFSFEEVPTPSGKTMCEIFGKPMGIVDTDVLDEEG